MIYHVLAGDSLTNTYAETGIDGETIVCRECLVVGPVDADTPLEFWDERARFILAEYAEDEIEYHERVADELERLGDIGAGDEVNLWFEYELFCSVNMWFCLARLQDSGATVYRVEPVVRSPEDRWKGFGGLDAPDLKLCWESRKLLIDKDIILGAGLWDAYRKSDHERLQILADQAADRFPYLKEVCEAAIDKDRRPAEILYEIMVSGKTEFADIFGEFSRRAGVYGFGDLQVSRILDQISS